MAWLRICRPGSVIGPQQPFLIERQQFCWNMKKRSFSPQKYRTKTGDIGTKLSTSPKLSPKQSPAITTNGHSTSTPPTTRLSKSPKISNKFDETAINEYGKSQGDRLLERKAQQQHHQGTSGPGNVIVPSTIPASSTILPSNRTPTRYSSATTPIKQLKVSSTKRMPAILGGRTITTTNATRMLYPINNNNNTVTTTGSSSNSSSKKSSSTTNGNIPVG